MLGFAESLVGWLAVTSIPAFAGLLTIVGAGRYVDTRYLAAFAFGIFMWFFVDTIGGAANLDVNAGLTGGIDQVAIILLFVIGLVIMLSMGGGGSLFSTDPEFGFAIPLLVAIAVGIHGFGEGVSFGSTASTTASASILDAFGGVTAGTAYTLHKALEPMMIGACYLAYSRGHARSALRRLVDVAVLTAVFVIPSLVGASTGYYISYDSTYLFALGTGTAVYAALRLTKPLFRRGPNAEGSSDSINVAVSMVFGFLAIYGAALLHA